MATRCLSSKYLLTGFYRASLSGWLFLCQQLFGQIQEQPNGDRINQQVAWRGRKDAKENAKGREKKKNTADKKSDLLRTLNRNLRKVNHAINEETDYRDIESNEQKSNHDHLPLCEVMKNKEYAVIVAGGKGTRMGSASPKQFLTIGGLPILMHAIEAFYTYSPTMAVILVLPQEDFGTWKSLCVQYNFNKPVILQQGGASRFQSVKSGLSKIVGEGLVAIHDGVRPLVSTEVIAQSFKIAAREKSAVAAVNLKESIRIVEEQSTKALDRSLFKLIQTPQTFDVTLIKEAYRIDEDLRLTDDASVAERAGHNVTLFEGSYENIKVTTPEDLIFAEAFLNAQKAAKPA